MVRRIIKFCLAAGLYYSGILALKSTLFNRRTRERPRILMYHRVIDDADIDQAHTQPGMCVTRTMFDRQMGFLSKCYKVLKLEELVDLIERDLPIPKKSVVITFDDGWKDNFTNAFPILKKHNLPATIFLPIDFVETGSLPPFQQVNVLLSEGDFWPTKAARIIKDVIRENDILGSMNGLDRETLDERLKTPVGFLETLTLLNLNNVIQVATRLKIEAGLDPVEWDKLRWIMTWDEIREMNRHGIDFGSHGITHDLFNQITDEQIRFEVTESRRVLEAKLGRRISTIAYPAGRCNETSKRLIKEAGYRCALAVVGCSQKEVQPDLFALRRTGISDGTSLGPTGGFSSAVFAYVVTFQK